VSVLFLLLTLEHMLAGFVLSFWFPLHPTPREATDVVEEQVESVPPRDDTEH
jgi:hypothetical protein